jgi:GAF domain-containing protein
MVSLFDRRYQHIVAEAIRPPAPGQPPLAPFNALAFERVTSVCEHVVTGDARSHTVPGTESGLTVADIPVSIINHLDSDARFCQIQDPARQFYAGVPIRSPAGVNIGVYCVFDHTPRPQGLREEEIHFIRDLSVIIMDYLAYKRSHEWYHREQRMLRGLGGFVEGEAGLPVPKAPAERDTSSSGQLPSGGGGTESPKTVQAPPTTAPATLLRQKRTLPPAGGAPSDERTSHTEANGGTALPVRPPRPPSTKDPTGPADESRSGIERIFSRAANLIRESLEIEGAVFLDANIRSYGGMVGNMSSPILAPRDAEARHSPMESGSSDESAQGPGFDLPDTGPAMSRVLGFSTARTSSIAGNTVPAELSACRERFLHRLLQRYPKGRIFNFEADGALSDHSTSSGGDDRTLGSSVASSTVAPPSPTDHGGGSPAVRPRTRPSAAERVVRMFPGARSVAVVPLWDPQTGRVFAGGFLWTRTPTRIFSRENELSYLRVFGLAIMAEVARQKLRAADKAKTDILGSISHELRTPLHGLVGTIEMLRNTALDGFQKSVLWTLDTSARTLLDIVDHVSLFRLLRSSSLPHR